MIRLRPSGVDEILIKRVQDWYEPGPGVFIQSLKASFSPAMLFTGSTTGAWYDPSDTTTLYRDAAGTTPVTAVEQPVGLMLDKSGRGNHAFNSSGNSANFPVLSARYNLLTKTEQFDDGVWVKTITTISPNTTSTTDPLGGNSADVVSVAGGNSNLLNQSVGVVSGITYVFSVYVKAASGSIFQILGGGIGFSNSYANFDLTDGSKGTVVGCTAEAVNAGNGWWKCIVTQTASANDSNHFYCSLVNSKTSARASVLTNSSSIYIWGADLRVANDDLNQPSYQRVNTATDYDTVGFKPAEVFDGVDDNLIASAGGGSTTAFFWCSAIRVGKVGAVQTLFSDAGTNTGYRVRINASNQLELSAGNGTAYTTVATTATLSIGQRAVLTAWHDGTNLNVQINNGTVHQAAFATATAGTAQFTIGKDNNAASNFFAGRLYENVYTKDNVPSSAQITSTKTYVANVAGITLS